MRYAHEVILKAKACYGVHLLWSSLQQQLKTSNYFCQDILLMCCRVSSIHIEGSMTKILLTYDKKRFNSLSRRADFFLYWKTQEMTRLKPSRLILTLRRIVWLTNFILQKRVSMLMHRLSLPFLLSFHPPLSPNTQLQK